LLKINITINNILLRHHLQVLNAGPVRAGGGPGAKVFPGGLLKPNFQPKKKKKKKKRK